MGTIRRTDGEDDVTMYPTEHEALAVAETERLLRVQTERERLSAVQAHREDLRKIARALGYAEGATADVIVIAIEVAAIERDELRRVTKPDRGLRLEALAIVACCLGEPGEVPPGLVRRLAKALGLGAAPGSGSALDRSDRPGVPFDP